MGLAGAAVAGVAVAGVAGGVMQAGAARDAASAAANADKQGIAAQQNMYNMTRNDLLPYNTTGQNNLDAYGNFYKVSADQLGQAYNQAVDHIPQPMTEANLVNTPGYQFNLSQGLKAAQNSAAAKGLGVSGAAMNSASNFATGLADSTYQNQFANQQTIYSDYYNQANQKGNQLQQIYNQISAPVTTGENAAAQTGQAGTAAANAQSALYQNIGTATAAGINGQAAGYTSALNAIGNAPANYLGAENMQANTAALNRAYGGVQK